MSYPDDCFPCRWPRYAFILFLISLFSLLTRIVFSSSCKSHWSLPVSLIPHVTCFLVFELNVYTKRIIYPLKNTLSLCFLFNSSFLSWRREGLTPINQLRWPLNGTSTGRSTKLMWHVQPKAILKFIFGSWRNQVVNTLILIRVGWICRIHRLHLCRGVRPPPPLTSVLDMTLNNLIARLQYWRFGECRLPLHCHCSYVPSGSDW